MSFGCFHKSCRKRKYQSMIFVSLIRCPRRDYRVSPSCVTSNLLLVIANFQAGQTRRLPKRTDALLTTLNIAPNDCRRPLIAPVEFVNETLSESISDKHDYLIYKSEKNETLCFMDHPFLLTTSTKNNLLFLDNRLRMYEELRDSFRNLNPDPYLKLHVTRERLVEDALIAVSSQ